MAEEDIKTPPVSSLRDEVEFPEQGGPIDQRTGLRSQPQRLPGPVDQPTSDGGTDDPAQGSLRDASDFPTAGGPDHHGIGVGVGQHLPGPVAQQVGSLHEDDYPAKGSLRDDHAFPTGGGPVDHSFPLVGRGMRLPGNVLQPVTAGLFSKDKSHFYDLHNYWHGVVTYIDGITDGDGQEWLGGMWTRQAYYYDATQDDWHTLANNYSGIGRDGNWYYNGVIADTSDLSFGTLANGHNDQAWNYGSRLPFKFGSSSKIELDITGDDELHTYSTSALTGYENIRVHSAGRWCFTGDFSITVDFKDLVISGGTDGGLLMYLYHDGAYYSYIQRTSASAWNSGVRHNDVWATSDSWTSTATAGKLRFTRVGNLWTMEGYDGTSWHAFRTNYAWITAPVYVMFGIQGQNNRNVDVKISNVVTTGVLDKRAGWAIEDEGTHRGAQDGFPEHALIVSTSQSVDIIDLDNDKLWLRTIIGNNYAFPTYAGNPTQVAMKNGYLVVGIDEADIDGAVIFFDFRADQIRKLREVGSSYTGALKVINNYTDAGWGFNTGDGAIRNRHTGNLHYTIDYDQWQIADYSVEDTDLYYSATHCFFAHATGAGVTVHKMGQTYDFKATTEESPNIPLYGHATETDKVYWVEFDDAAGDIYYMTEAAVHHIQFATFNTQLSASGGTWTSDTIKTVSGTLLRGAHRRPTRIGSDIYLSRVEGVYKIEWPSGSWVLYYAATGATHNILPPLANTSSTGAMKDGSTDLLLVGMENGSVVVINPATDTVWGISPINNRSFYPRGSDG